MILRRSTALLSVTAGLLAGGAALGAATLIAPGASPAAPPLVAQDIRHDDAPGDISGPCDEAEHANDPRCAGSPVATGGSNPTTPTTSASASGGTGTTSATAAVRTLDAAGAGTVRYTVSGSTLTLVSATPAAGWRVEIEQSSGREIEVDFRSGTRRVQANVEFEDGAPRERVRTRDDATNAETRVEDGVVVRSESSVASDDNSGPDSGSSSGSDDSDHADDDSSGSGSGSGSGSDDSDDDNSGSGSADDSSGHGSDD